MAELQVAFNTDPSPKLTPTGRLRHKISTRRLFYICVPAWKLTGLRILQIHSLATSRQVWI